MKSAKMASRQKKAAPAAKKAAPPKAEALIPRPEELAGAAALETEKAAKSIPDPMEGSALPPQPVALPAEAGKADSVALQAQEAHTELEIIGKQDEQNENGGVSGMKILFAASEGLPFIASGGLADVAGSLPVALRANKHDCRVVLPL